MSAKIEKLEKSMVKITIEVPAEEFEKGIEFAYNKNKAKMSLPGFRKGKVPRSFIEKAYGIEYFYEDAVNHLLPEAYANAVTENDIDVVAQPDIDVEQVEKGKSLIFTATVAVKPEVTLGEYMGIEIPKVNVEVTDEEIDSEIKKVQEQNARMLTITDREVKDGDIAVIDYEGFAEGVAFEGGKGTDYSLTIGSHSFIDTFEDQIIGKKTGDDFEVNVTFPTEYHSEELAGKPAMFKVQVKEIKAKDFPVVDDEFAKDVSEFDTLDEYKADIKAKLKEQKEKSAKFDRQDAVVEKIVANTNMDIPNQMIDAQADQIVEEFEQRLKYQGLELDQYLKMTGSTKEMFKQQAMPDALRRVQGRLILEAIVKAENVVTTEADVEAEIKKMAEMYKMEVSKLNEAIGEYEKTQLKNDIKIQKALDIVTAAAKEV
ncbi:MAG: trigger factor [Clostridiales bacterium]|jgi:trigger factor|nr:trigger factor [Clostridiales bacterium]